MQDDSDLHKTQQRDKNRGGIPCPQPWPRQGGSWLPLQPRGEQGQKLHLWVMFSSAGLGLGQRDVAVPRASSASLLGLAPAGQARCACAVKNRAGGLCSNNPTSNHFHLRCRMLILTVFFQYVLCVVFAIQLLPGGCVLHWGARLCCRVLPALALSVVLATAA